MEQVVRQRPLERPAQLGGGEERSGGVVEGPVVDELVVVEGLRPTGCRAPGLEHRAFEEGPSQGPGGRLAGVALEGPVVDPFRGPLGLLGEVVERRPPAREIRAASGVELGDGGGECLEVGQDVGIGEGRRQLPHHPQREVAFHGQGDVGIEGPALDERWRGVIGRAIAGRSVGADHDLVLEAVLVDHDRSFAARIDDGRLVERHGLSDRGDDLVGDVVPIGLGGSAGADDEQGRDDDRQVRRTGPESESGSAGHQNWK